MITLYNAARCPYAARARIVLAEKGLEVETVEIDLSDRPAWLYEKNPAGRVPVIEEDGGDPLPESTVIMEFLEERYPEPALMPADPTDRAAVRLLIFRDKDLTDPYYALRRGENGAAEQLDAALAKLDVRLYDRDYLGGAEYSLADIALVPWVLRARDMLGVELSGYPSLGAWLARLEARPAIAAEAGVVAAL
ncbi:MAG TPA: glutathione S-transferase family protein [Gaiellaceae bacterium]